MRHVRKPKRRHSCTGKQKHATKESAKSARARLARQKGAKYNALQVYRCSHCWIEIDGRRHRPYHVGHRR